MTHRSLRLCEEGFHAVIDGYEVGDGRTSGADT